MSTVWGMPVVAPSTRGSRMGVCRFAWVAAGPVPRPSFVGTALLLQNSQARSSAEQEGEQRFRLATLCRPQNLGLAGSAKTPPPTSGPSAQPTAALQLQQSLQLTLLAMEVPMRARVKEAPEAHLPHKPCPVNTAVSPPRGHR